MARFGLGIEAFGGSAIAVREVPAILGTVNARALLLDILDELADQNSSNLLQAKIEAILSRGLSWLDPVRAQDARRGNERTPARDGKHASFRAMQPRTAHLCRTQAGRY